MTATMLQASYFQQHQLQDYTGPHSNIPEVFFSMGDQRFHESRMKTRSPSNHSYDSYYGHLPDENNYQFQLNFQPGRRDFFNATPFNANYENEHAHQQQSTTTTSKSLLSYNKKSLNDNLLKESSLAPVSPADSPLHLTTGSGDRCEKSQSSQGMDKYSPRLPEPHQNLFFQNHRQQRYPIQAYHSQEKFPFSNHGNIYYPNESPYCSQFSYCQNDSLFFSPAQINHHHHHRLNANDKSHSPDAYLSSGYTTSASCRSSIQAHNHQQNSFQSNLAIMKSISCNNLKPSPPLASSDVVAAAVAAVSQQRGDAGVADCDPRDLEAFAEHFKQRRIKLGATQADVGAALGKLKLPGVGSLSQSTICRFESLTLSHNNMVALKPILQAWLCEAENAAREARMREEYLSSLGDGSSSEFGDKKRKRTSIAGPEKRSLEAYFAIQPRPSGEKIAQIADKLDLRKNVVRVWFCNQRQKQKRMKFSASSLKSAH